MRIKQSSSSCCFPLLGHDSLVPGRLILVVLLEPQLELSGVFLIALLADGFQDDLIELGLYSHLLVAGGAGKVVDTPKNKRKRL